MGPELRILTRGCRARVRRGDRQEPTLGARPTACRRTNRQEVTDDPAGAITAATSAGSIDGSAACYQRRNQRAAQSISPTETRGRTTGARRVATRIPFVASIIAMLAVG